MSVGLKYGGEKTCGHELRNQGKFTNLVVNGKLAFPQNPRQEQVLSSWETEGPTTDPSKPRVSTH